MSSINFVALGLGFFKCPEVQVPRVFRLCAESASVSLSPHCDDLFHQAQVLLSSCLLSVHFFTLSCSFQLFFLFLQYFLPSFSKLLFWDP